MAQKSRIELLRERKEEIERLIRKAQTEQNAKNRKLDTREKIITGVMFQGAVTDGIIDEDTYHQLADRYLNERDRALVSNCFQKFLSKKQVEPKPLDLNVDSKQSHPDRLDL